MIKQSNIVIISYWTERKPTHLYRLLKDLYSYDAGVLFSVVIVCNGGKFDSINLPEFLRKYDINIMNRANTGFNIGAWDHGWRNSKKEGFFLFLQDDCYIVRNNWFKAFIDKVRQFPNIGLLGEKINARWQKSWEELRASELNIYTETHNNEMGMPVRRVDMYLDYLYHHNIPTGKTGEHIQSLIIFTSSMILKKIGGFNIGKNYGEAIASEIAISKKVLSQGYKISEVGPRPFYYIGHRQWVKENIFASFLKKSSLFFKNIVYRDNRF